MPKCEYCGKPAKMGLQLQSTHHTLIQSKVDKICIDADVRYMWVHTVGDDEGYPERTIESPFASNSGVSDE